MPKILPAELILELSNFAKFDRKWANCRVSFLIDKFLLEKMGDWLIEMKKMVQLCKESIDHLCNAINGIEDEQQKTTAACRAFNGMKKFVESVPSLPALPALTDLSFDEEDNYAICVLNKCSDLVRVCCQSAHSSASALGLLDAYINGMIGCYETV
ncbi:hypothetical protein niasHT_003391 [Heterodera trifolii]|uniref:Uncharacterized protein n=1 Tax=Heterodera trifolii TaxID=157864 RepID=A0ABD2LNN8_9BILA